MNDTNPVFHSLAVIEENIRQKLTVDGLADSIHMSKYHYQRVFREIFGDSVMRYVTRRRLSLAAADLAQTDAGILDIALKYGYESHEGFTRSFRAYMGVSPKEYRKYHFSIGSPRMQKEKYAMLYSKTTDEIIRNLNSLIVQIKETAVYTRKNKDAVEDVKMFYSRFWNAVAANTESLADGLGNVLGHITDISQHPDEISARFLIVKTIEDIAFKSNIMSFQIRLMLAGAQPKHRAGYEPICSKYVKLAQDAQLKAGKIVDFFNELSELIFRDMQKNAIQKLKDTAAKGYAAAKEMSDGSVLPYSYIADEIGLIAEELSLLALEEVSESVLEDYLFRLDIIASSAELDLLGMPSCKPLGSGIQAFREEIEETLLFFQSLSEDIVQGISKHDGGNDLERTTGKTYSDLAFQSNILLFYLRGEVQKLGQRLPSQKQEDVFDGICGKMNETVKLARCAKEDDAMREIAGNLQWVYEKAEAEGKKLGAYGGPVLFIADEIRKLADYVYSYGVISEESGAVAVQN